MTNNVKVIFVDWNKTLSNSLFWGHLKDDSPDNLNHIESILFKKELNLILPWMRGEISVDEVLSVIVKETKLSREYLINELTKSCKNMQLISNTTIELISKIRKNNIKVVIATDNMDVFDRYTVLALDLKKHFDGILNSYNLKCLKTDQDENGNFVFFSSWLNENGIAIEDAILLDDSSQHQQLFESGGLRFLPVDDKHTVVSYLENYVR